MKFKYIKVAFDTTAVEFIGIRYIFSFVKFFSFHLIYTVAFVIYYTLRETTPRQRHTALAENGIYWVRKSKGIIFR